MKVYEADTLVLDVGVTLELSSTPRAIPPTELRYPPKRPNMSSGGKFAKSKITTLRRSV